MMNRNSSTALISRRLLLALGFASLVPRLARAALSPQDSADLQRVQDYMNSIHTLESRFEQTSGQGGVATGTIYLSRPGQMRVEYDPPVPILLVATQGRVWYYDKKLEQVDFYDLRDTPAWFLLQTNVSFGRDITVKDLKRDPGAIRVTVSETKNPDMGEATLVFSDRPLELRRWDVLDAQKKTVSVTLDSPHYGAPLNPSLFYWTDPRPPNARGGG